MLVLVPTIELLPMTTSTEPPAGHRFGDGWPAPFYEETRGVLGDGNRAWYVADGDVIVGIIGGGGDGTTAQIGYGVCAPYEGRGYATAAVVALLDLLWRDGVERVVADTFADHAASRRVLEKAGLSRSGSRREEVDGELADLVTYEIRCPNRPAS